MPSRFSVFTILALSLSGPLIPSLQAQWNPLNPVTRAERQSDGVLFGLQSGAMHVRVCTDSIIRVTYSPTSSFPSRPDYVVTRTSWPATHWTMQSNEKEVSLVTERLRVTVNRKDGAIAYSDPAGKRLVQEGPKTMTPANVNGEDTWQAETFIGLWGSTEAFYGLGQHQAGVWNYRGESVDISQDNTKYASEKPADPIELRVYRGADGSFTLYEDENDTYNYEKGVYATIPMLWNEARQSLTIGDRKGGFPGMLGSRTFRIVFAGEGHGTGVDPTEKAEKVVQYSGKSITIVP